MPTVLRDSGFRFFFYGLQESEPPHIHVEHGRQLAKFWLNPVDLAESSGFRANELKRLRSLLSENRLTFLEAWNGHFGR